MSMGLRSGFFERKMSRKEFLGYLGLIILTMTGITGAIKSLSDFGRPTHGFGSGPYGGVQKKEE